MSLHQIIYTGRKNGLYGGEPGFGVLSADRNFPLSEVASGDLCDFRAPDIGKGIALTENIISCMPVSYSFRRVNGGFAFTRSAFLGTDPFSGRSNHISHAVLFEKGDTDIYPCELIGSPSFMEAPSQNDVYADGVGYLPEPVIVPSGIYTVNKVMKFLAQPGNFDIFKNMLWALMHADELDRKIIICDDQENIALWITAINYALPVSFAKTVSFTTYAYDPDGTDADICGVTSKHTAYNESYADSEKFFVFDIPAAVCFAAPEFSYAENELFSFLSEVMLHDYDKLRIFHSYLDTYTDLEKVTPDIAGAYLMSRASGIYPGGRGFDAVSPAEFDVISDFSGKNARYGGKLLLSEAIIAVSETVLSCGTEYVEKLLVYIAGVYKDASAMIKAGFRSLSVDSVPVMMISKDSTSVSFRKFYNNVSQLCSFCGVDLCDELVSEKNRKALLFVIKYQHIEWKANFVLELISEHVHSRNISYESLMPDSPQGRFLSEVACERYKCGSDAEASEFILSLYFDNVKRFCAVEENLESVKAGGDDRSRISKLYAAFADIAAEKLTEQRRELFDFLSSSEKYVLMWETFERIMNTCDIKKLTDLFDEHYNEYFSVCPDYQERYLRPAIETYYAIFKEKKGDALKEAEDEIFGILLANEITVASADEITGGIISRIRLTEPMKETERRIGDLCRYISTVRQRPITGRLLCLAFGLKAKQVKTRKDYDERKPELLALTVDERADLTQFSDDEAEAYLKWVLPYFTSSVRPSDTAEVYDMFRLSTAGSVEFTEQFCRGFLSEGKNESDYTEFCEFLRFVFTRLGMEEVQEVSYQVHKLNQKRIDRLKENAKEAFANDYTLAEKFNDMMESVPKRRSIFDMFRK